MVWADWCSQDSGIHCGRICGFAGQPQWAGGCVVAWFGDWADVGGVGRLGQDVVRPRGGDQATNQQRRRTFRALGGMLGNRQALLMLSLVVLSTMVICLIDIHFKFQVAKDHEGNLNQFFGQFYTYSSLASWCCSCSLCATADERWGDYGHHCAAGTVGDLLGCALLLPGEGGMPVSLSVRPSFSPLSMPGCRCCFSR